MSKRYDRTRECKMKNLSPIGARSASKSGERAAPDLAQLFADGLSKIETKRSAMCTVKIDACRI